MIPRLRKLQEIRQALRRSPVVGLLGARQVGKTTLARQLAKGMRSACTHYDLEDSDDLARLAEPMMTLRPLRGTVIIDEIQRRPDLFPTLRVLADRPRKPCRFLVLGSASPQMLRQSSESLAGRIAYKNLPGLALDEVGGARLDRLWLRGGFPRSFTARTSAEGHAWRRDFVTTFLERDLPQLGVRTPAVTLRRFWTMAAHYHGQLWNARELGRSLGATDHTAKRYLDLLCSTYVLRQLRPWHANTKKRQVKSPKVYLTDTGILHTLLSIRSLRDLRAHPKAGASWEGLLVQQVVARLGADEDETYFWRTHAGLELDLLIVRGRKRIGFEFKLTTAPQMTRSMRAAMEELGLSELYVVYAGQDAFPLASKVVALPATRIWSDLKPLR